MRSMPIEAAAILASSSSGRDESIVGTGVGTNVGDCVGAREGAGLGEKVGEVVGPGDGDTVGPDMGANKDVAGELEQCEMSFSIYFPVNKWDGRNIGFRQHTL